MLSFVGTFFQRFAKAVRPLGQVCPDTFGGRAGGHGDVAFDDLSTAGIHLAMGQNPNRLAPSEHPNPTTKLGSKLGGEYTYPKM